MASKNIDWIIAVPSHHGSLAEEDHSLSRTTLSSMLANQVSEATGKPVLEDALVKHRETRKQSTLSRQERLRNLKGSFSVGSYVGGMHFLLIDDVMTTGATANEITKVLKQAGAESVFVLTLARTPEIAE